MLGLFVLHSPQSSSTCGAISSLIGAADVTSSSAEQSGHRTTSPQSGDRANGTGAAHSGHGAGLTDDAVIVVIGFFLRTLETDGNRNAKTQRAFRLRRQARNTRSRDVLILVQSVKATGKPVLLFFALIFRETSTRDDATPRAASDVVELKRGLVMVE